MARGDYVDVTYRTGAGTETKRTQARSAGSSVEVKMPGRGDLFVEVTELNAGQPPKAVQTSRFAAGEVVAVVEGNASLGAAPKKAK
jgi:hypothetical protein